MHVVVVGAGAIGTLYGGWLLAGGGDVSFVARGSSLAALTRDGLELRGDRGTYGSRDVVAADDVAALRPADILVYTVKLFDLEEAVAATRRALVPGGLAIGLQNGVDSAEILGRSFAPEQVMIGPVYSAARLVAPGIVVYSGRHHQVLIGGADGTAHPLAEALLATWRRAEVDAILAPDIRTVLWTKFLAFATNAALTCLSRQSAGIVYHDPDLLDLAHRSIGEIAAVARHEGIELPARYAEDTVALMQSFPPDMVASMRQDLDAGRRLELDGICGAVRRYGRKHGVPTPVHDVAYACLKPFRDGIPPSTSRRA